NILLTLLFFFATLLPPSSFISYWNTTPAALATCPPKTTNMRSGGRIHFNNISIITYLIFTFLKEASWR
ncbi:hypothetical protein, partial [Geobacillus stearothermophilus]|uniref:hypothetical protein n=1 Tax=Geobacillus stearothermophilus TaxID=1422 RepID=UPI003D1AD97E